MSRVRTFHIGIALTIFYLFLIALLGSGGSEHSSILDFIVEADPNALGDFLAGIFSPLAFLWLILGYLLQNQELKLQRDELAAQKNEIAKTNAFIEAQTQYISEQTRISMAAYVPFFIIRAGGRDANNASFKILNRSGKAYNVRISNNYDYIFEVDEFEDRTSTGFSIPNHPNMKFYCIAEFSDGSGTHWRQRIQYNGRCISDAPVKVANTPTAVMS